MIEVIILDKELYTTEDIAPKTLGSAGLDLKLTRAAKHAHQLYLEGRQPPFHDLIGTGLKVRIPTNMVGLIIPRSSTGHKDGFRIGNTIGVIDSDYRGEIMMSVGAGEYSKMQRGYACAQLVVVPYSTFYGAQVVDEFSDADTAYGQGCRAEGGFGSTDLRKLGRVPRSPIPPATLTPSAYNLLAADSCPGKGCMDQGCPHHYACTDLLPEQKLSVLQEFDHETAQIQYEQYALNQKNGGF